MDESRLGLGHWFSCVPWTQFFGLPQSPTRLKLLFALLSVSFVSSSWLAFRYSNLAVRILYTTSVVWLGFSSFFFFASWACWIVYFSAKLLGFHPATHVIGSVFL